MSVVSLFLAAGINSAFVPSGCMSKGSSVALIRASGDTEYRRSMQVLVDLSSAVAVRPLPSRRTAVTR